MSEAAKPLAEALKRLTAAVDTLDSAALRRLAAEKSDQARATELELMRGDRAKLAELLDQALTRGRALEAANRDAVERIDRAMTLIAGALPEKDG